MELGAGAGIVGVALARVGAGQVVCTDGDAQALDNCVHNLTNNLGVLDGGQMRAERLAWDEGCAHLAPDVILGADLLYDPIPIPALLRLVKQLLQLGSARQAREQRVGWGAGSGSGSTKTESNGLSTVVEGPHGGAVGSGGEGGEGGIKGPHGGAVGSGAEGGEGGRKGGEGAVCYLATMRRIESTLQVFLDGVSGDTELRMEEVVAGDGQGCGVRFQHVAPLEAARERIVLHKLWVVG